MTNRRKVITKAEAIEIAWSVGPLVSGLSDEVGLEYANHEISRGYKWRDFDLTLEGSNFYISDSFAKHRDGRIRSYGRTITNPLAFAQWFVRHFPDRDVARDLHERLQNPALVAATIEDPDIRKAFKRITKGVEVIENLDIDLALATASA